MIQALKILTEASGDIKDITYWYKDISSLLAIRFVSQLYDGLAKITANPGCMVPSYKKGKAIQTYRFSLSHFILPRLE